MRQPIFKGARPSSLMTTDFGEGDEAVPNVALAYTYAIAYVYVMKASSYSELRKNLASVLDRVAADHEPVIVTRDRGKPAAVLMSLEDYASFEETRYLLRSPANARRLKASIAELDAGKGRARKLAK